MTGEERSDELFDHPQGQPRDIFEHPVGVYDVMSRGNDYSKRERNRGAKRVFYLVASPFVCALRIITPLAFLASLLIARGEVFLQTNSLHRRYSLLTAKAMWSIRSLRTRQSAPTGSLFATAIASSTTTRSFAVISTTLTAQCSNTSTRCRSPPCDQ